MTRRGCDTFQIFLLVEFYYAVMLFNTIFIFFFL